MRLIIKDVKIVHREIDNDIGFCVNARERNLDFFIRFWEYSKRR